MKTQLALLKKQKSAYGGILRKTRAGRLRPRPLSTKYSMHLVLRSSKAKKEWSFLKKGNPAKIEHIVKKSAKKHGIKILSLANVGNHLHFHIRLGHRYGYRPFIRAITGSIAMAVTGARRDRPLKTGKNDRFWDYRPYTRIVEGLRSFLNLKNYIEINQLEGFGWSRLNARLFLASERAEDTFWNTA